MEGTLLSGTQHTCVSTQTGGTFAPEREREREREGGARGTGESVGTGEWTREHLLRRVGPELWIRVGSGDWAWWRRTTLREEGGPHSGRKEDHTQGRLQQREDYSRGKTTSGGRPQQGGHIHPLQWVLVDAVDAGSIVGAVDAVKTSVDHCMRTWSSL